MNLKKVSLAMIIPALMAGSLTTAFAADEVPQPVSVEGGKISFTGSVVSAPCSVDNASDGQSVNLGQISTHQLSAKGESSSAVPFTIKLAGCNLESTGMTDPEKTANYTSASISFNGVSSVDDTTLALQSSGGAAGDKVAQNVGIQILQNNTAVNVTGNTPTSIHNLVAGPNEIPFSASYIATGDTVVAGSANSVVNFKINYE